MATFDDLLVEFPEPARSYLQETWQRLPPELRQQLDQLLKALPVSLTLLKQVLERAIDPWKVVVGTGDAAQRTVAIVGPANVGKSTLYNQLVASKEDQAEVSPIPGTTRENQEADAGLFTVIDTPGADAVGEVGEREREIAFGAARQADFLVIVFEATRGVKRSDHEMYEALVDLGKPFIVVLNKMDLIPRRERQAVVAAAASNLGLEPSQVIGTVAPEGKGLRDVILAIAMLQPNLVVVLGQAMTQFRTDLSWLQIRGAAIGAGAIGWLPIPFADMIPLLALQSGLVLALARIWGYKISLTRARELLATFGAGVLARELFRQLAKLGGIPGGILSAAVAAAATYAMGYAALVWFARGERLSADAVKKLATDMTNYFKDRLAAGEGEKGGRRSLRRRIEEALRDLPEHFQPEIEPTIELLPPIEDEEP